jgi:hypothetical protein
VSDTDRVETTLVPAGGGSDTLGSLNGVHVGKVVAPTRSAGVLLSAGSITPASVTPASVMRSLARSVSAAAARLR